MILEIKVPSPGESISEVEIASWLVEEGEYVTKDQEIAEVESDKATLPLIAEKAGRIKILAAAGETVNVGDVVCSIDTSARAPDKPETSSTVENPPQPAELPQEKKDEPPQTSGDYDQVKTSPLAAKMMEENGLSVDDIIRGLKKITRKEVGMVLKASAGREIETRSAGSRDEDRRKMSRLRKKLGERLVSVKNETAMLTTFNECDMSQIMGLRNKYQSQFTDKHVVKLGFMSFFVKAVTRALSDFPNVNSRIEKDEIVSPRFCDIGIAVQTDKGLMVPVIRNAESMSIAEIEKSILDLAGKARSARISLDEMSGGSFTITNGGVFGSMLSTPLLNPPQSAILGMHNIQERPVVEKGQIVIRPIMYLALSYDHRLIDGRDSVSFLVRIKKLIENPANLLLSGTDPGKQLLDL